MQPSDVTAAGPLPEFLIIGAPKAGTSALYVMLAEHPQIFMAAKKELDFFTLEYGRGEAWYRAQFAPGAGATRRGEATPHYLASHEAICRAHELVPQARLIALLRDPVRRAYSHYWMQMAKYPDQRPSVERFCELARAEMRDVEDHQPAPPNDRYLWHSLYGHHLEQVRSVYPPEQVLVLLQEQLKVEPERSLESVYRFLDVDEGFRPSTLGHDINTGTRVRSTVLLRTMLKLRAWQRLPFGLGARIDRLNRVTGYPPLPDRARAELEEWFEPDLAKLSAMGVDVGAWGS